VCMHVLITAPSPLPTAGGGLRHAQPPGVHARAHHGALSPQHQEACDTRSLLECMHVLTTAPSPHSWRRPATRAASWSLSSQRSGVDARAHDGALTSPHR
jgi:hypothetical protein